jgi:hypothetical protein
MLVDQIDFYWQAHLRPRLDGLTDEEYFWEPVAGCWNLRRRPDGTWAIDGEDPEPEPPPVTPIAWRIVHIGAYNIAPRTNTFFNDGSVPDEATMHDERHVPTGLPTTAADAITFLDETFTRWRDAIAGLDDDQLLTPLGPRGGYFADDPMAALILHVSRETIHHGAEIGVLRDLYRARYRSAGSST